MPYKIASIIIDAFLIFISVPVAYQLLFGARKRRLKSEQSMHWPTTAGVVVGSSVKAHRWGTGSNHSYDTARISYEYTVDGKKYKNTRFSVDDLEKLAVSDSDLKSLLAKYPKGKELIVYYDPQDPKSALLFPKVASARTLRIDTVIATISSLVAVFFAVKLLLDLFS